MLYLGRGNCFPIALEGALKLKEISYIHAEGYAAGEMKHGPIALIDKQVPVIAIAPSGPLFEKTASNLQEAAARGGQVIVFSDAAGAAKLQRDRDRDDRAAGGRSVRGADPVRDPGAVAGLSRGGAEGHRRRSAAQSGEVGDGGVSAPSCLATPETSGIDRALRRPRPAIFAIGTLAVATLVLGGIGAARIERGRVAPMVETLSSAWSRLLGTSNC